MIGMGMTLYDALKESNLKAIAATLAVDPA